MPRARMKLTEMSVFDADDCWPCSLKKANGLFLMLFVYDVTSIRWLDENACLADYLASIDRWTHRVDTHTCWRAVQHRPNIVIESAVIWQITRMQIDCLEPREVKEPGIKDVIKVDRD